MFMEFQVKWNDPHWTRSVHFSASGFHTVSNSLLIQVSSWIPCHFSADNFCSVLICYNTRLYSLVWCWTLTFTLSKGLICDNLNMQCYFNCFRPAVLIRWLELTTSGEILKMLENVRFLNCKVNLSLINIYYDFKWWGIPFRQHMFGNKSVFGTIILVPNIHFFINSTNVT